ncbi:NB-ARC domain-containing protein [Moorena sp. SIO3A2]|uniref:NB-ARC domain-containing protein n=1 Tax=Moorena sp. SIO3A2 TaxID=2607841 RepID=UPI00338DC9DF
MPSPGSQVNQTRPNQAPPLPRYYVERPEVSQRLKQILLSQETARVGTLVVSAIYGLGGIGKSTITAALAHDPDIQSDFPDGIFWATLGQQPDILSFLSTWIQALGDYDFKPINIDSASLQLRTLLSDQKALLVVDDVWHPDHVEPFRVAGGGCRVLVTTREAPVKGAIPYNLDVMTLNQSLELLTGCFNNKLTNQELEYAKTLAKTVGYLPLGLELAAAQIGDGFSWEELLDELQAEIADLEALDRWSAEEEPSDAKRKNYSLVASFNLSLKRLSPERLKKFAWLGVLPEDVTITETMATTLWNCNSFKAKKTLRYLRQKALLLPGVSSTQETNYRLHDLLHDLARNLLQPELTLSITEAHQQLLERYQTKTEKGLWHTLPDDGYIYNHLTWHLEKAQKIDQIHQLLKEETPAGDNGWYWQCDRQGKTANFIKDVSKAWAIAAANFKENPTESISLQCRYALITTSLNSLAGNIPPRLMAALVDKEIWTPAQGLAYVRQSKDYKRQAEGLRAISKYLPSSLLPEALDCARGISHEEDRANTLRALAPHLSEVLLHQALEVARGISDEDHRADALIGLAPHLPQSLLPQVLDCAREIKYEYQRALALIGLAPHLPDVLLPQALDCARGISDEYSRARALVALAPDLPDVLPQALDCARRISDQHHRALALGDLAPYLPDVLPEALDCARGIWDQYHRANALVALASHLPDVLSEALDCARRISDKYYRALALGHLAPHLPDVLSEALDCARGISFESSRALALIALAPHLPDVLPEALDCARGIEFENSRADALVALVPHLPDVLPEALDCARRISDENSRALALVALVPHLPDVLPEALDCARGIGHEYSRADALVALVPHLPDLLPEALDCARGISDQYHRAEALVALAPQLPDVLSEALDCARGISHECFRGYALVALVPHLPDLLPEALDCARGISDQYHRAEALVALAPQLPDVLSEALDCARGIRDKYFRARALVALAPHLPDVLPQALDCARGIKSEKERAHALVALAPHLPDVLLPKALDCARGISDEKDRADALVALAPHLPDLLPEALDCARAIGSESNRASALQGLIKRLTPSSVDFPFWQQILDGLASLTRPNFLKALPELAPLIIKFGGIEALIETVAAVDDVSRWWK